MKVLVTRFAPDDDMEMVAMCWLKGESSELRSGTLRLRSGQAREGARPYMVQLA